MEGAPGPEAIAEEEGRLRRLRLRVDVTCALLRQGRLERRDAEALVAATRGFALELFPGKEGVFDLVLAPRFARLLDDFCRAPGAPRGPSFRRP